MNSHYKPQYQLCLLHRLSYHMMLDLDHLVPEQLALLQEQTGFAEDSFKPHVTCVTVNAFAAGRPQLSPR